LTHQLSGGGLGTTTDSPTAVDGSGSPTHPQFSGTRDIEKMRKSVLELVDTESAYVKVSFIT